MKILRHAGPLAAVLGCAIWLAPAASAACKGTDTAALVACIGALEAKVDSLQTEVTALKAEAKSASAERRLPGVKAENASYAPGIMAVADSTGGDTVKAPFTVTDDAGNVIFKVVSLGGGSAKVIVGANNAIQMYGQTGLASIELGNSAGRVGTWTVGGTLSKFTMGTSASSGVALYDNGADGGLVRVKKGNEALIDVVANTKMTGMQVYTAGVERANIGVVAGKGGAVRILSEGKAVAAMGANMDEGGAGALFLGMGGKNSVTLLSNSGGQGALSLFNAGDTPTIQLRASDTTIGIFGEGGTDLGALRMSPNSKGGNITLMNSSGAGVLIGGGSTQGDGNLCVSTNKFGTKCLGNGSLPLQ